MQPHAIPTKNLNGNANETVSQVFKSIHIINASHQLGSAATPSETQHVSCESPKIKIAQIILSPCLIGKSSNFCL